MKIAYVAYWKLASDDGVAKKIDAQIGRWRAVGHEVELFDFAPSPLAERWRATRRVAAAVVAYRPEVVYVRYDLFLPPIRRVLRGFPTAVEVNTYDRRELRGRRRRAALYNELGRRLVLGNAAGIVCVTEELVELMAEFGKPTQVVANGIDLGRIAVTAPPANEQPRLVWVGAPDQPWQGLDKLAFLAEQEPDWRFDVIGVGEGSFPENVAVHGFLREVDYVRLYASADVAVGMLALHRRGVEENSPLKVREYLAYGLPVITGNLDPDFPREQPWFLLRLPNVEANVREGLGQIRDFVDRVRGRRVAHGEIAQLDLGGKEALRLEFMHSLKDRQKT